MRLIDEFDLGAETGVLMAEALLQAVRDPVLTEAMGGLTGSRSGPLEPRLELAQERGVIRGDIAAERLARLLAAFLDGYLVQRMADPDLDATAAADTLIALLSPPGEERP